MKNFWKISLCKEKLENILNDFLAVEEGKDKRIGRHDQQDDDGRGKHADTEAFGLAFGGIEFGVGSFHNSGLAIPGG